MSSNLTVLINDVEIPCQEGTITVDWKFQQRATAEFTIQAGNQGGLPNPDTGSPAVGYRPQIGQTVKIIDDAPGYGYVVDATIAAPGFSYTAGETVAIPQIGSDGKAQYMIDSVDGIGRVTAGHVVQTGSKYEPHFGNVTIVLTPPFTGTGLTLDLKTSFSGPTVIFGGTINDITESSIYETEGNPISPATAATARTTDVKCVSFEQRLDKRYTPGASETNLGSGHADVFVDYPSPGITTLTYVSGDHFTPDMVGRAVILDFTSRVSVLVDTFVSSTVIQLACNPIGITVGAPGIDFAFPAMGKFTSSAPVFRSFAGLATASGALLTYSSGDPFDPSLVGAFIFIDSAPYRVLSVNGLKALLGTAPPAPGGITGAMVSGYFVNQGINYEAGDVLTIGGGSGRVTVDGVHPVGYPIQNGAIGAFHISTAGSSYTTGPYTASGGAGTGAEFYVTAVSSGGVLSWSKTFSYGIVFSNVATSVDEGFDTGNIESLGNISGTLVYDNVRVSEALDDLASRAGAMWYIDPTPDPPKINFIAKGALNPPFHLSDWGLTQNGFPVAIYRNISAETTRVDVRNAEWIKIALTDVTDIVSAGSDTSAVIQVGYPIASITNVNGADTNVGVLGVDTGKNWYFIPGYSIVARDPSNTVPWATVQYAPAFQNSIVGQNSAAQTARQAIEGGSGIYEHQTDSTRNIVDLAVGDGGGSFTSGTGWAAALAQANVLVAANQDNVINCTFEVDTPGFLPGMLVPIQNTARNLNGNFLIDEIQFRQIRRAGGPTGDYYSGTYQVICLTNELQNWLDVFVALTGKGGTSGVNIGGGGAAATIAGYPTIAWDIDNSTIGTDVSKHIGVNQAGASLDLNGCFTQVGTMDFTVVAKIGATTIGTLTIPASTPSTTVINTPCTGVSLPLGSVPTLNITASDGICTACVWLRMTPVAS